MITGRLRMGKQEVYAKNFTRLHLTACRENHVNPCVSTNKKQENFKSTGGGIFGIFRAPSRKWLLFNLLKGFANQRKQVINEHGHKK